MIRTLQGWSPADPDRWSLTGSMPPRGVRLRLPVATASWGNPEPVIDRRGWSAHLVPDIVAWPRNLSAGDRLIHWPGRVVSTAPPAGQAGGIDNSVSGFKRCNSTDQGSASSRSAHTPSNVAREACGCSRAAQNTSATSARAIRCRIDRGSASCVTMNCPSPARAVHQHPGPDDSVVEAAFTNRPRRGAAS